MNKTKQKLHLFQFASVNGHPLKTLHRVQAMLKNFSPKKGDWLIFPEMWPAGFLMEDIHRQRIENAFCFLWLKRYARTHQCYMAGSMLEMPKKEAYNSAYLIGPKGQLLSRYRKIHLFRLGDEHRKFSPGKQWVTHPFPWGKLGLAICYDLRFPELFRKMSDQGTKLIMIPSAWPTERIEHFLALLKARAIENQCYIVGANKIGHHDSGIPYGGHSSVFGPWGEKLGELKAKPGILSLSIDMKEVDRIRKRYPIFKSRVLK
jgi:predicted amidohydrolase